jgi:uncharacterized membrane protein
MTGSVRQLTRIALFAALVYVLSWATAVMPNVSVGFFVVFTAGFLWGGVSGAAVGGLGAWLFSTFNPYGPAALPVTLAQVAGMACSGLIGAAFARIAPRPAGVGWLVIAALTCTLLYYAPVTVVDAWLFQPFWPRIWTAAPFVAIAAASNVVIFPLLFKVTLTLYTRERGVSW